MAAIAAPRATVPELTPVPPPWVQYGIDSRGGGSATTARLVTADPSAFTASTCSQVTGSGPITYHSTVAAGRAPHIARVPASCGGGRAPGPAMARGPCALGARIPETTTWRAPASVGSTVTVSPTDTPRRSAVASLSATWSGPDGSTPSRVG